MKLLLDSCVAARTQQELSSAGYDTIWTGSWESDPGDEFILNYAYQENRVLITLDKDFGEMAIVKKLPHAGIVRLVNLSVKQQSVVCLHVLSHYSEEILSGAIVTAEPDRVRIRPSEGN